MAGVSPPRDAAMPVLPSRFATVIVHFAPLFYHRSWRHAEVLLIGAIAHVFAVVAFNLPRPVSRTGHGGTGVRTSPISCLLHSSRQTTGRRGSCGRW